MQIGQLTTVLTVLPKESNFRPWKNGTFRKTVHFQKLGLSMSLLVVSRQKITALCLKTYGSFRKLKLLHCKSLFTHVRLSTFI